MNERSSLRGRRAFQAEQTRRDILGAARRRFAEQGYAGTALKDIAGDAGVSVQTVYDSIGSKADLVLRLNDLIDEESAIGDLIMATAGATDPRFVAGLPARVTRRLLERCGDLIRTGIGSSQADAGLVPAIEEGGRRHRAGAATVAGRLAELGALRDGLTADEAATTIGALADARLALVLLDDHGLDLDQLEAWITDTTARAVLAPPLA